MNQVTEMLRLAPGAPVTEAIARLAWLFEMMSREKGFRNAELVRNVEDPDLLLVLHAWDNIEDWQAFRSSDAKIGFAVQRPDSLYTFQPCGMNWRHEAGESTSRGGAILRREVVREPAAPRTGPGVVTSATFSYRDYEPEFAATTMRLTRLRSAPGLRCVVRDNVVIDDLYEPVMSRMGMLDGLEAAD